MAGFAVSSFAIVAVAGCGCWLRLLAAVAGGGCWRRRRLATGRCHNHQRACRRRLAAGRVGRLRQLLQQMMALQKAHEQQAATKIQSVQRRRWARRSARGLRAARVEAERLTTAEEELLAEKEALMRWCASGHGEPTGHPHDHEPDATDAACRVVLYCAFALAVSFDCGASAVHVPESMR